MYLLALQLFVQGLYILHAGGDVDGLGTLRAALAASYTVMSLFAVSQGFVISQELSLVLGDTVLVVDLEDGGDVTPAGQSMQ